MRPAPSVNQKSIGIWFRPGHHHRRRRCRRRRCRRRGPRRRGQGHRPGRCRRRRLRQPPNESDNSEEHKWGNAVAPFIELTTDV